jgi:hypothetical protein
MRKYLIAAAVIPAVLLAGVALAYLSIEPTASAIDDT